MSFLVASESTYRIQRTPVWLYDVYLTLQMLVSCIIEESVMFLQLPELFLFFEKYTCS
jgi:hypothetical protein